LGFIYRNDILDAIDTVFKSLYKQDKHSENKDSRYNGYHRTSSEANRDSLCFLHLSYYGLHKLATEILCKNISYRDFKLCVEKMTKDGDLREYEMIESKRNIKPKLYSHTQKARMRCRLKIQQETIGQREKAYQLLLLYSTFGNAPVLPANYDQNILEDDKQLENFLAKEFSLHSNDFIIDSVGHNRDLYRVTYMIRKTPIPDVRYLRIDYLRGSVRLEGKYHYRYILPGISIREFLRGIHGGQTLEHLPESLSQLEVEEYFNLLVQQGLIKLVLVFHGEIRYDIVDGDLKSLLGDCWVIHGIAFVVMRNIWRLVRKPTEEEHAWYEMLWGKQRAMIHLNQDYEILKTREKDPSRKGYRKVSKEDQLLIMNWGYRGIVEHFNKMKEKHRTTIQNHSEISHMLLKMVYPPFLHKLIENNII
jgi:hypothetical protein